MKKGVAHSTCNIMLVALLTCVNLLFTLMTCSSHQNVDFTSKQTVREKSDMCDSMYKQVSSMCVCVCECEFFLPLHQTCKQYNKRNVQ